VNPVVPPVHCQAARAQAHASLADGHDCASSSLNEPDGGSSGVLEQSWLLQLTESKQLENEASNFKSYSKYPLLKTFPC